MYRNPERLPETRYDQERPMDDPKKVFLIGNAHLDPVWLWRWPEGLAEIKATFRSALDRMEEFPEFVFTSACAAYYQWVEENCPEMFEEIRQRVREGRWSLAGGWWIQPDCNLPSGESFARHGLYSQRYFLEKFGVVARVGYNVDSFGHSGMLPQILVKSGMESYVFMRPMKHEKELPGSLFWWESQDGSRVLAYRVPYSYGSWWHEGDEPLRDKTLAVAALADAEGVDQMGFYGVGNHGGGPTIANLRTLRRLKSEPGGERYRFSSPDRYFDDVRRQGLRLPVVKDDLQHHASGFYSAHSRTKRDNRRVEHGLASAEKFSTLAHALVGLPLRQQALRTAWEKVMFNQFHDIMGGCSIAEAYADAAESTGHALSLGAEVLNASLQKLSWAVDTMGPVPFALSKDKDWILWEAEDRGAPYVVFNPLSWEVDAPIQVNRNLRGVADDRGRPLSIQKVRASQTNGDDKWDVLFRATVPAMGYKVFWMFKDKALEVPDAPPVSATAEGILENDALRLEFDGVTGRLARLFDKDARVEVLSGPGAEAIVVDETDSDTWAHGIFAFRNEVGRFSDAEVRVLENGPVRAALRVTSRFGASVLRQDFHLYAGRREVEVRVKLDWHEKHRMLKLAFPVAVASPEAVYEIPYGHIRRPVDGDEEPGGQWLDVSGAIAADATPHYGLALLNDGRYAHDVKDNELRLTVVRSPIYADHYGVRDDDCEFMDQGVSEFRYGLVPHAGSWQDAGVVRRAYELNVPPTGVSETYHQGPLPTAFAGISIDVENVVVTAFKPAEDGNGHILRLFETAGRSTIARISLPFLGRTWTADIGACAIMTYRIPEDPLEVVTETDLIELSSERAFPPQ
jgi:alpha-mannosidase